MATDCGKGGLMILLYEKTHRPTMVPDAPGALSKTPCASSAMIAAKSDDHISHCQKDAPGLNPRKSESESPRLGPNKNISG